MEDSKNDLPDIPSPVDETISKLSENCELSISEQDQRIAEQQQNGRSKEVAMKQRSDETASSDIGDDVVIHDSGVNEHMQFTVKLEHHGHDPAVPQVTNETSEDNPGDNHIATPASEDLLRKSHRSDAIEQESGGIEQRITIQEPPPPDLRLDNPQMIGSDNLDNDNGPEPDQPLNYPIYNSDEINYIKEEPGQGKEHQIRQVNSVQGADSANYVVHSSDGLRHIPGNEDAFDDLFNADIQESADARQPNEHSDNVEDLQDACDNQADRDEAAEELLRGGDVPQNAPVESIDTGLMNSEPLPSMGLQDGSWGHGLQQFNTDGSDASDLGSEEVEDEDEELDERRYKVDTETASVLTKPQEVRAQRHQVFTETPRSAKPSPSQPHSHARFPTQLEAQSISRHHQAPSQTSQPPTGLYNGRAFSSGIDEAYARQLHEIEQTRHRAAQNLYALQQRGGQQAPGVFDQSRLSMPPVPLMNYSGPPQGAYQYAAFGQQIMNQHYPGYMQRQFGQVPQAMTQAAPPLPHGYHTPGLPPAPINWMPGPHSRRSGLDVRRQTATHSEHDTVDISSDDDEPLRTRVKRHPSVLSQDSIEGSSQARKSLDDHRSVRQDQDSDVGFVVGKPKIKNAVQMQRPLPQPTGSATAIASASPSEDEEFSFSLPKYEVQRQPLAKGEDIPSVKVSLPNLVREELLLSPDHAEQEVHLLLNLFLPGQQALATPDPAPATALLNFHTIAVMVIEAYVQFEIGDELGLGRGHFHQAHNRDETEYERMRDAKDANVNEIFFAVVDRWRAGLESKKQALSLIRGAQEFCDVALDVIYYIKEHGLLRPEPKARKERSDKGVKRESRKKEDGEQDASKEQEISKGKGKRKAEVVEEKANKAVKRGTVQKPNVVAPRKKVKTEKAPRKAKNKGLGVTVVRRK